MRSGVVLVLLACGVARADEPRSDLGVHTPLRLEHQDEPILHLDPIPPLATEGLGAEIDSDATMIDLGPRAKLVGEGSRWKSSLSPNSFGPDMSRGWRTRAALSYDLGPFTVGASIDYGHVDGPYERGTYRTVGVSIYRTFQLSRWMRAWIALSAGRQSWLGGQPPPGEANGESVMLSIGTTFR